MNKGTVPETTRGSAAPCPRAHRGAARLRPSSLSPPAWAASLPHEEPPLSSSRPALLGAHSSGSDRGQSSAGWEEKPVLDLLLAKLLPGGVTGAPERHHLCLHTHNTHTHSWWVHNRPSLCLQNDNCPPALDAGLHPASHRDSHFINGRVHGFLSRTTKTP